MTESSAGDLSPRPAWASPLPAEPAAATDPAQLRVSDAEREAVVARLTAACAEGRLTLEEMGGRVGSAYAAVTRADLEPLTHDLPAPSSQGSSVPVERPKTKKKWHVTVMGELKRGISRLPEHTNVVTFMGASHVDLRNALVETPEMTLHLYCMMGEQQVVVPDGVEVEVSGFVFMGEKHVGVRDVRPRPGVPRLHIRAVGMMGEINIRTA